MIAALPVILPLLTLIILLFAFRQRRLQPVIGIAGAIAQLCVAVWILVEVKTSGILVLQSGNWEAPFGITLVIDMFSAVMVLLAAIVSVSVNVYAVKALDRQRRSFFFYPLVHGLMMGVYGAFTTGDVFNMYVWYEVMLTASFVLLTLGGEKEQLKGAVKYVTLNLIASLFFLAGIGLLYRQAGTLNMADLFVRLSAADELVSSWAVLFFVGFSIKAALFPFFFWLPASYYTPPVTVTALFAGLLTKVGVYSIIRFFTLFLVQDKDFWHPLFLWIAGFTMVIGVLTAASQYDIRRILSFHIISQIGYMIMGLGLFSVLGIAGAIYYMAHNIIAKTNTFLVAGLIHRVSGRFHLRSLGGLYKSRPFLAILFIIPAFGLAGIPPLSGFFGKLILITASFAEEQYVIGGVALMVGLFTLFSMVKIWNEAFWKPAPDDEAPEQESRLPLSMLIPVVFLGLLTLGMGFAIRPILEIAQTAASQLLDPQLYAEAVLKKPIP